MGLQPGQPAAATLEGQLLNYKEASPSVPASALVHLAFLLAVWFDLILHSQ